MTHVPRVPRPIPKHELVLDEPMSRGITSINVRPDDKEVFVQFQHLWSLRHGRPLRQWEAFTLLVAELVEVKREELARAGVR